jgi:hypothetical protein
MKNQDTNLTPRCVALAASKRLDQLLELTGQDEFLHEVLTEARAVTLRASGNAQPAPRGYLN